MAVYTVSYLHCDYGKVTLTETTKDMREQRRHRRVTMNCLVKISHPSFGTRLVRAKDFSDSGIFLMLNSDEIPPLGTIVKGQVQGLNGEAPRLDMEVVRIDQGGIGLCFVDPEDRKKLH